MITSFFHFSLQNVRGTWYRVHTVTRNTPRNNIKCNFMPRNTYMCTQLVYMVPTKVQSASVCGTSVPVG